MSQQYADNCGAEDTVGCVCGMCQKPELPDPSQAELDEILENVYEAGFRQSRLLLDGKGANTITSDALYKAKQSLTAWTERNAKRREVEAQLHILRGFRRRDFNLDSMYETAVIKRIAELTQQAGLLPGKK